MYFIKFITIVICLYYFFQIDSNNTYSLKGISGYSYIILDSDYSFISFTHIVCSLTNLEAHSFDTTSSIMSFLDFITEHE